jgi:hypothetical protein
VRQSESSLGHSRGAGPPDWIATAGSGLRARTPGWGQRRGRFRLGVFAEPTYTVSGPRSAALGPLSQGLHCSGREPEAAPAEYAGNARESGPRAASVGPQVGY